MKKKNHKGSCPNIVLLLYSKYTHRDPILQTRRMLYGIVYRCVPLYCTLPQKTKNIKYAIVSQKYIFGDGDANHTARLVPQLSLCAQQCEIYARAQYRIMRRYHHGCPPRYHKVLSQSSSPSPSSLYHHRVRTAVAVESRAKGLS